MLEKIGRNEPCPCGSGKKYKNCCANMAEIIEFTTDPWMKANQLMTSLKVKMENYYKAQIKKGRRDAMHNFLRFATDEENMAPDYEAIFSDWLWFDIPFINQKTIGQDYAEQTALFVPVLKEILQSLNNSYLSVYRAKESQGYHLLVEEMFSGQEIRILLKEPWETEIVPRILLLGRVVTIMENHIFSGMVLVLQATEEQEDFLVQHVHHWQQTIGKSLPSMFKSHGEILLGFFDHAYHKNLIRLRELYRIALGPVEKEALHDRLSSDYIADFQAEGFTWYKPKENQDRYVRIAIGESSALFCADFLKDLDDLQILIQDIAGNVPMTVIHSKLSDYVDPNHLDLWFLILKDQETERWLTTPLVDLDNQTPAQVLTKPDGKERILTMLTGFIDLAVENEFAEMRDILCYIQERVKQM